MRSGPWRSVLRRDQYSIAAGETFILHTERFLPRNEQRDIARAVAVLPELLDLLADVEDYFGDRPQSDFDALQLHARMTKIMELTDVRLKSAV
jgi:hypothetical protein